METYIIFYNKNGNRKFALCLNKKSDIFELSGKLAAFVDDFTKTNDYVFSYANVDRKKDLQGVLKNIPIANANSL